VAGTVASTWAATLAGELLRSQLLGRAILLAAVLACGILPLAALGTPGRIADLIPSAQKPVPAAAPEASTPALAGRTIDFRVVERSTGNPLPDVRLTVVVGATKTVERTTDETGVVSFEYPSPKPNSVYLRARKEGFLPMRVWLRHPAYDEEFPATFTLTMVPAISIGGFVKDEDGRPLSGAKVSPILIETSGAAQSRAGIRIEDALTDVGGHWTCPSPLSGSLETRLVGIQFRHPDFEPLKVGRDELEEAIGPRGTVVLHRGIAVTGQVVDHNGHPVRAARVGAGRDWFGSDPPIVETDPDGRFRLGNLRPGQTVITVQAKGHGPGAIEIDPRTGMPPVKIMLGAARTIRGRVVDAGARPLPGIRLQVVWWRGFRTLDWKAETESDGQFLWEDAPHEDVWINVRGNGFIALENRVVPAAEAETVIKLARTLRVTGTVVDFRTRKPIESFKVTPGTETLDRSHTYWDTSRTEHHNGGRYEVRFPQVAQPAHILRIEADGYSLGISRPIKDDEGEARVDFELAPVTPSQR
jgi:protocatechuate 3,4-dioxygenase beta subunit